MEDFILRAERNTKMKRLKTGNPKHIVLIKGVVLEKENLDSVCYHFYVCFGT